MFNFRPAIEINHARHPPLNSCRPSDSGSRKPVPPSARPSLPIEITLSGEIISAAGQAVNGMVMDSARSRTSRRVTSSTRGDLAFLAYGTTRRSSTFSPIAGHKRDLDVVPTAENLASEHQHPRFALPRHHRNHLRLSACACTGPHCWRSLRSEI